MIMRIRKYLSFLRIRPIQANDRGSILLVGMLVILVLAGLAMVAARNVILEYKQVGNFRTGEVSLRVSESGAESVMALSMSKGPDGFKQFLAAQNNKVTMASFDNFFDVNSNGSFGKDYKGVNGVNFVTELSLPVDVTSLPGYAVPQGWIFTKYRTVTSGFYGDQNVSTADDTLRNSSAQIVTYSYIGPSPAGGAGQ